MAGVVGGSLFLPKKVEASGSVLSGGKPLIQTVSGGGADDQYLVQEATVVGNLYRYREHCSAQYLNNRGKGVFNSSDPVRDPTLIPTVSNWNLGQKVVTVARITSKDLKTGFTYGEFLKASA